MGIKTAGDITAKTVRGLREDLNQSQSEFWGQIGLTQSGGSRYESGRRIPKPIKTLIFLRYVARIEIDASTPASAKRLIHLGALQAAEVAEKNLASARKAAIKH